MILDGWGKSPDPRVSAIDNANTPFIDSLYTKYPNAQLRTDGLNVGLPEGQMGNSEVGHMNLGAGRIVYQDLAKINLAVQNKNVNQEKPLIDAFKYALENNKKLHFLGLVSNGGVHSHTSHLYGLLDAAKEYGLEKIFVHAFTDGRDVDPKSAASDVQLLENHIQNTPAKIATVIGRYYAMDRDKRWERVKLAYDLLTKGKGISSTELLETIRNEYENGITDEFLNPIVVNGLNGSPLAIIEPGDIVINFNFRTDRGREISMALTQFDFPEQDMKKLDLDYITFTEYDKTYQNVNILFGTDDLSNTLGEVIEKHHLQQIRAAETEKYPHVTFFFSGGKETAFEGEKRIMIPSPKVATYDLQPEMSAIPLKNAILAEIESGEADFMCVNFANPDMVGHTGVYSAIVKAVETVDSCVKELVEAGKQKGYSFIIIADHGNADFAINEDGSPNTAHSTNPVPCFLIGREDAQMHKGILADVAPTILKLMNIDQPAEMTGKALF